MEKFDKIKPLEEIIKEFPSLNSYGSTSLDNGDAYAWEKEPSRQWAFDLPDVKRQLTVDKTEVAKWLDEPKKNQILTDIKGAIKTVKTQAGNQLLSMGLLGAEYFSPSMTPEEAKSMINIVGRYMVARNEQQQSELQREGVNPESFTFGATNAIGQAIISAATGLLGGSAAATAVGVTQVVGSKKFEYSVDFMNKTGKDLSEQPKKDDWIVLGLGAIEGLIDRGLGAERIFSQVVKKGLGKEALKATGGEALEEGLQEPIEYLGNTVAGYENRTYGELMKDSLKSAVFGALAGGTMGTGMYMAHRSKIQKVYEDYGFSPSEAKERAIDTIETGKFDVMREMKSRAELQLQFGDAYAELEGKIKAQIEATGKPENIKGDLDNYVQELTRTFANQLINVADIKGVSINEVMDIADIEQEGVILRLNMPDMKDDVDLRRRLREKKEQAKVLKDDIMLKKAQKIGVEAETKQETAINLQIKTLENRIARLNTDRVVKDKIREKQGLPKAKTHATQAVRDSQKIALGVNADNFIEKLGKAEKAKLTNSDGTINNVAVQRRYNDAVLASIIKDPRMFERLILSNEISPEIQDKIVKSAETITRFNTSYAEYGLNNDLNEALRFLEGTTLQNFAEKAVIDKNTFGSVSMAYVMLNSDNAGFNDFINTYADNIEVYKAKGNPVTIKNDILAETLRNDPIATDKFNEDGSTTDKTLLSVYANINNVAKEIDTLEADANLIPDESGIYPVIRKEAEAIKAVLKDTLASRVTEKGKSLTTFIRDLGGIYDFGGELASRGIKSDIAKKERANKKGKKYLEMDYVTERVFDAGYFPEKDSHTDITFDEMVEAIENDYFGKRLRSSKFLEENKGVRSNLDYIQSLDQVGINENDSVDEIAVKLQQYYIDNDLPLGNMITAEDIPDYIKDVTINDFEFYQSAFHGSPHRFDKFALEHLGTGEGNQAYGWGLYFTSNRDIAESYRKQLTKGEYYLNGEVLNIDNPEHFLATVIRDNQGVNNEEQVIREELVSLSKGSYNKTDRENAAKALELFDKGERPKAEFIKPDGQLYEIEIPNDNNMLDYTKTLDEQPQQVKEALKQALGDRYLGSQLGAFLYKSELQGFLADELGIERSYEASSKWLNSLGIKGIKYPADMQRGARGEQGYNYLVFDDSAIEILNTFYQRKRVNASYNINTKEIILGKGFNSMSLPHEMAHFWLDYISNDVNLWREGGLRGEKYVSEIGSLWKFLGVSDTQRKLTRDQQERFATLTEQYLTNRTALPAGTEFAVKEYLEYVPEAYNSFLDFGYVDSKGKVQNPLMTMEVKEWFDKFFTGWTSPNAPAPEIVNLFVPNQEPASEKVIAERQKHIESTAAEERNFSEALVKEVEDTIPLEDKIAIATKGKDYEQQAKDILLPPEVTSKEEKFSFVRFGRGTNTRKAMSKEAVKWVKANQEKAIEIAMGDPRYIENDSPIERGMLIRAVMEANPTLEDTLKINFALSKSLSGKTLGLNNDTSDSAFLIGLGIAENNYLNKYLLNRYGNKHKSSEMLERELDKFVRAFAPRIMNASSADMSTQIKLMLEEAGQIFGTTEQAQLFQTDIPRSVLKDKNKFVEFAKVLIKKHSGALPSDTYIYELMTRATRAQIAAPDMNSEDVNIATAAGKEIRAYQDFLIQSEIPLTIMDKIVGGYASRSMLSGIGTHLKNLVSNTLEIPIVRTALTSKYGKSEVSKSLIEAEAKRMTTIYEETLLSIPQMHTLNDKSLIAGEVYRVSNTNSITIGGVKINTLGKTKIPDPLSLLGRSDFYFRRVAYLQTLAHIATFDAKKTGQNPDDLFKLYKQIGVKESSDARIEAIMVSNIAVFTHNGELARVVSNIRKTLDNYTARAIGANQHGLGTLVAPFVKTPSNIIQLGAEAIASPFVITKAKLKGEEIGIKSYIDVAHLASAVTLAAVILAAGCDYEPPYEVGKKYDKKKHYDSIKIGNVWIKLDLLGVLAMPTRLMIATKDDKLWTRAVEGSIGELPVDFGGLKYAISNPVKGIPYFVESQLTKLIPSATAITRPFIKETGLTMPTYGKIGSKLAKRLGLDGQDATINDYIGILLGSVSVDQ